jgi:hypothetical protein
MNLRNGFHLRNGNRDGGTGQHHLGASAKAVAEHASAISRLEVELATLELKRKATELAVGSALSATAALLGLFALGFAFAAAAAGLATVMPWWAALLVVTGALLLVAAILVLVARSLFRRAAPPVPEGALREVRLTKEAISG